MKESSRLTPIARVKKNFALGLLLLLISVSAVCTSGQSSSALRTVLLVGSGPTYYHNMPIWLGKIAKSLGAPLDIRKAVLNGASFAIHISDKSDNGGLISIRKGGFDVVVLQDTPDDPLRHSDFFSSLARLADEANKIHAQVILFETYAYGKGADFYLPSEKWSGGSPTEMLSRIRSAYMQASEKLKVKIAPVGDAFDAATRRNPEIDLYEHDKLSPSECGSYLTACVLAATLTGKDPRSLTWLPDTGVTKKEAEALRLAAASVTAR